MSRYIYKPGQRVIVQQDMLATVREIEFYDNDNGETSAYGVGIDYDDQGDDPIGTHWAVSSNVSLYVEPVGALAVEPVAPHDDEYDPIVAGRILPDHGPLAASSQAGLAALAHRRTPSLVMFDRAEYLADVVGEYLTAAPDVIHEPSGLRALRQALADYRESTRG